MHYTSQSLTFEEDKIYFIGLDGTEREVMMDWEDTLMSASAAYVTEAGGDILEIGFGMGISAGYIQSHSITSHTILENHPDIIPRALNWAKGNPKVTIITGSWFSLLPELDTYDGVFHDTYGDYNLNEFSSSLTGLVNTGGRVTWWNTIASENNIHGIPDVTYDHHQITPPSNSYFNNTTYYLPKKQF